MKGKSEVLEVLQHALTDELGAAHGYMLHAEMCENWGYKSLAALTMKRAIEEMHHAEKLIERILFLDGTPDVQKMPEIVVGADVQQQLSADFRSEREAIAGYNEGMMICQKAADNGSCDLLRANLLDEERHADFLETELSLIRELGLTNYLTQKMNA